MIRFDKLCMGILFLFVLLTSCVKEDRKRCPCRLILDMEMVDVSMISEVDVNLTGKNGFVYTEHRSGEDFAEDDIVMVPRGQVFVNVYYGHKTFSDEGVLRIPIGQDCPQVYMYSALVNTDCEFVRQKVDMRKNHCVLNIHIEGKVEDFPYGIAIRGNVCGYDSIGQPMPGEFHCMPKPQEELMFTVVLPRQMDSSMTLEINDESDVLKEFALGEYVKACGYDWTEDNLKDITVGIDYSKTQVRICVKGWDEVYEFDVVI